MDVYALGALLGVWREGISSSTTPLYPTRGQWQVAWYGENLFPFPFSTLIWRLWVQIPWKKFLSWRDDINAHADFPISLPSHTSCSLLPRTFLPLLLLGLEISSKLLTITRTHTYFPIFLFYRSIHKLCLCNFLARACFVDTKNSIKKTLFAITLSALHSLFFDVSVCWVGDS